MSDLSPWSREKFEPDEQVRVVDGTFAGMEGRIIGPDEARRLGLRVWPPSHEGLLFWLMLRVFDQEITVSLQSRQIAHQ
jgi:transcription antitermination factor NusG